MTGSGDGSRPKIAKWKIWLVLSLASTLVSMWTPPFFVAQSGKDAPAEESPRSRRRGGPVEVAKVDLPPRPAPVPISLDETLSVDPFQAPDVFAAVAPANIAAEQEKREQELQENEEAREEEEKLRQVLLRLRQEGVSTVIETPSGPAARLGDRIVHVGDSVDGFIVVRISTREGVVLSREQAK